SVDTRTFTSTGLTRAVAPARKSAHLPFGLSSRSLCMPVPARVASTSCAFETRKNHGFAAENCNEPRRRASSNQSTSPPTLLSYHYGRPVHCTLTVVVPQVRPAPLKVQMLDRHIWLVVQVAPSGSLDLQVGSVACVA